MLTNPTNLITAQVHTTNLESADPKHLVAVSSVTAQALRELATPTLLSTEAWRTFSQEYSNGKGASIDSNKVETKVAATSVETKPELILAVFSALPVAELSEQLIILQSKILLVREIGYYAAAVFATEQETALTEYLRRNGADVVNYKQLPIMQQGGAFISDMDSTMVACECIDKIAALVGVEEQVAAITEQAMQGKLDFSASLGERVALLKGVAVADFAELIANLPIMPGAVELLSYLQTANWQRVLVSGGFTPFASYIADKLGFNAYHANELAQENAILTGQVNPPIVDAQYKEEITASFKDQGLQTIAIGDGANDIPMLQEATLGIAYHAKPAVNAIADLVIQHHDLSAVACFFQLQTTLFHLLGGTTAI